MSEWQPIETAPKDGTAFFALNIDGEIHVAKINKPGEFLRRSHQLWLPECFHPREIDGEKVWVREMGYTEKHEKFMSAWSSWTRLYEFLPTYWLPLPAPPATQQETE